MLQGRMSIFVKHTANILSCNNLRKKHFYRNTTPVLMNEAQQLQIQVHTQYKRA